MKHCLVTQLGVALVLLSLAAPAQGEGEPVAVLLEKATRLYGDLGFEQALVVVNQALSRSGNSRVELVNAYRLLGLCYASLGRYDYARGAFARLLALDPSVRLDSFLAPRVRAPFEEVLRNEQPRLDVHLLPPPFAVQDQPLEFTAQVKADNVKMVRGVRIWVRRGEAGRYSSVRARLRGAGESRVRVPADVWGAPGRGGVLSWYAKVQGDKEGELKRFGDELHPLVLDVKDPQDVAAGDGVAGSTRWYERWWVWTIVGGVLVAGTTAAVVLTTSGGDSGPHDFEVITR